MVRYSAAPKPPTHTAFSDARRSSRRYVVDSVDRRRGGRVTSPIQKAGLLTGRPKPIVRSKSATPPDNRSVAAAVGRRFRAARPPDCRFMNYARNLQNHFGRVAAARQPSVFFLPRLRRSAWTMAPRSTLCSYSPRSFSFSRSAWGWACWPAVHDWHHRHKARQASARPRFHVALDRHSWNVFAHSQVSSRARRGACGGRRAELRIRVL
jgi:hypothetical protein